MITSLLTSLSRSRAHRRPQNSAQMELRQLLTQPALVEVTNPMLVQPVAKAAQPEDETRRAQFLRLLRVGWGGLAVLALTPLSTFAQTPPAAPAAFQTAVTNIVAMIKAICGPAILLLLVAGLALIMWGGISENWKRRGLSIIGCAIIGAGLLFMFADPLAQFIAQTVGAGGTGTPPRP